MKLFVGLLTVAVSAVAFASEPEMIGDAFAPKMEISGGLGQSARHGDLTDDTKGPAVDVGVRMFNAPHGGFAGRSFLELKMFFQNFNADTLDFPFANDKTIRMSGFGLLSDVSLWSDSRNIVFLGIGPAVVTLSQTEPKDSYQSYGVFLWQFGYRRDLDERWSVGAQAEWFEVSQSVLEHESTFRSFTAGIRVGYVLQ